MGKKVNINKTNNLLIEILKYLSWLMFKPTEWKQFVKDISTNTDPAFSLADLILNKQWSYFRHPTILRLLIIGYLNLPILNASLVGVILFLANFEVGYIARSVVIVLIFSVAGMAAVSIAFGFAGALTGVFAGGLAITLALILSPPNLIPITVSMAVNCAVGVALATNSMITNPIGYSSGRTHLLGGMGGILFGSLVMLIIYFFADRLSSALFVDLVFGVTGGMVVGITGGVAVSLRTQNWIMGGIIILCGIIVGAIIAGTIFLIASSESTESIANALVFGSLFASLYALSYLMAERVAGHLVGVFSGLISTLIVGTILVNLLDRTPPAFLLPISVITFFFSVTIGKWRPYITYPFMSLLSVFFLSLDQRFQGPPRMLFHQPVFWDEFLLRPIPTLEDHLLLTLRKNRSEAITALEYLQQESNAKHSEIIQNVRIQIIIDQLSDVKELIEIADAHSLIPSGELSGKVGKVLKQFNVISRDTKAALEASTLIRKRDSLSNLLEKAINLIGDIELSSELNLRGFLTIIQSWKQVIQDNIQQIQRELEVDEEIYNPYIVGVPLQRGERLFVGRANLVSRIEDLVLKPNCPPLFLFGQRRIGKTSLLHNLQKYLSSDILPVLIDFQRCTASNEAGFLFTFSNRLRAQLTDHIYISEIDIDALSVDPIPVFNHWLDQLETQLGNRRILLELDEVDFLEQDLFSTGVIDRSRILSLFRSISQDRSHYKIIMGTSLHITELLEWTPYIINMQVLHIGYLTTKDTQKLIESPVDNFPLKYDKEAVERIINLTRCHPGLIQAICFEVVELKNSHPATHRLKVVNQDVEDVVDLCIEHAFNFFNNMNVSYLKDGIRKKLFGFIVEYDDGTGVERSVITEHFSEYNDVDSALTYLITKQLIELKEGHYLVGIELVKLWYRKSILAL